MPSATLINSVPSFSSPGTTPTSFNDIPPILRHREENVLVIFHPPLDGLEQEGTHGTLYVIDRFTSVASITFRFFRAYIFLVL
jgi:nucleotide-sensitive chloride channel 1A